MRRLFWIALTLFIAGFPGTVAAHDDPVVTVRVLCDGFNTLNQDQVLGELSADAVTITLDRRVQGSPQVQAWIKEQMDLDLRIEIVDIGAPQRLSDGYTLAWTARLSRQDWRRAGTPARQYSNTVVIHNGRITDWTGAPVSTTSGASAAAPAIAVPSQPVANSAIPELAGIPISLWLAACVALGGVSLFVRSALRK